MSAIGLNPTSVASAGPVIAKAYGLQWPKDRIRTVEILNKYRNLLYNLYDEVRLFDEVNYCICLSEFKEPCRGSDCTQDETWRGFTLPYDVAAVNAAWESGNVITQRSRWRETLVGRNHSNIILEMFEVPGQFATERDLKETARLKVHAEAKDDEGMTVEVKVIDADWNQRTLCFKLVGDGWVTVDAHVREIRSVNLPTGRVGGVTLAQEDGYELGIYAPSETVPAYRRYKVSVGCDAEAVLLQCNRRMLPVHFDTDIVEVGDQLVIEAAGRYFKYGENSTDSADIRRAEYDLARMKELLSGLMSRHRGNAKQDGTPYRGRPFPRRYKTLPGYRR